MSSFFRTYADPDVSLQQPFDVAVVMPTILRATLTDALASIFAQDFNGRIQVLVGIDVPRGDLARIDAICAERPSNCVVQIFYPGYSTSVRHGGLSEAQDGGVLRQLLSLLANSPLIAYLDDDNWWHPVHLGALIREIKGADYAFTHRWFVHPLTKKIVARDDWESVGPGRGIYTEKYGGFVDPSCLLLDKRKCADILALWSRPQTLDKKGMSADRTVFQALAVRPGIRIEAPTVYYRLDPNDTMHKERMKVMALVYEEAGR